MKNAADPLIPIVRAAALAELPKRGGLNKRMAKRPIRKVVRTGGVPGVGLLMPHVQRGYNDGVIRHPVFEKDKSSRKGRAERNRQGANENVPWETQRVGPGLWFDDTIEANANKIVPALESAMDAVIEKVIRG
jgi:hypothetical protein